MGLLKKKADGLINLGVFCRSTGSRNLKKMRRYEARLHVVFSAFISLKEKRGLKRGPQDLSGCRWFSAYLGAIYIYIFLRHPRLISASLLRHRSRQSVSAQPRIRATIVGTPYHMHYLAVTNSQPRAFCGMPTEEGGGPRLACQLFGARTCAGVYIPCKRVYSAAYNPMQGGNSIR